MVLKVVVFFSLIRGGYETTIPLAPISCNNSSFHSPSASLTLIVTLSGFLLQSLTAHSSGVVWKCSFSHLSLTTHNNITQTHTKLCHSSAAIMNSLTNSKLTHRHCKWKHALLVCCLQLNQTLFISFRAQPTKEFKDRKQYLVI